MQSRGIAGQVVGKWGLGGVCAWQPQQGFGAVAGEFPHRFSSLSCRIPELPCGAKDRGTSTLWAWYGHLVGSLYSSGAGNACPCTSGRGDVKTVPHSTYYLHEAKITLGLLFCPDAPRVSLWGALQMQLEGWGVGWVGTDLLFSSQEHDSRATADISTPSSMSSFCF